MKNPLKMPKITKCLNCLKLILHSRYLIFLSRINQRPATYNKQHATPNPQALSGQSKSSLLLAVTNMTLTPDL